MLSCNYKSISIPKFGNTITENEDNFLAPDNDKEEILKFAIADGATETSFSKEWSDLLVTHFQDHSFEGEYFYSTIAKASEAWRSITKNVDLPWYAEQKLEIGAFAAFLGIHIDLVKKTFISTAVGDCVQFHIRNGILKTSFPLLTSEEFNNTPQLIPSTTLKLNQNIQVHSLEGDLLSGDLIILASDALAAWFVKQVERLDKPWTNLNNLLSYENHKIDFQNWLNNKRKQNEIKNDDVTLILINFIDATT